MCDCCSSADPFAGLNDMVNDVSKEQLEAAIEAIRYGITGLYGNNSDMQALSQLPLAIFEELLHIKMHEQGLEHDHGHHSHDHEHAHKH